MEKDIPRRPGMGPLDVEQGGSHGFRVQTDQCDHTGDKLLPNVLCSMGGTKSKSHA